VSPRWHDLVIALAIAGIAVLGVFALWGADIERWIDGDEVTQPRGLDSLPGVRRTPL
jgi:hypothetical protein